ncbi:MAG TPA: transglycosylase SLT domain-containing protein [Amycolatopsis sp.]|nr:transglycosylase SLT domain-containing protein [Amycolatopsis sp.]
MKSAGWAALAVAVAAASVVACAASSSGPATPSTSAGSANTGTANPAEAGPPQYAADVVRSAAEAGIDPQLLMAILYNESYKPHDPASERAWQKIKPDAAFGVANMHKATFDETKRGRPFADRDWQELPDHPDLAIEAAAWYLHDLEAQLPAARSGHTTDELLALGYNTGPGNMRAFARGTRLGPAAQSYLDETHQNWDKAAEALKNA